MASTLLLPHRFKRIGWLLIIPFFALGIATLFFNIEFEWAFVPMLVVLPDEVFTKGLLSIKKVNITATVAGIGLIASCLLIGFSAEKQEDEFVANIRLRSLQWAVLVNYGLLILCFLFVYDFSFLQIMIYNMFTVLFIYIIRFHFVLYIRPKLTKTYA